MFKYNPFKENRAEQMTDLWKYYVPFPIMDEASKPIMVEGGRGSGKTMFFQCNSWRQVLSKIRKEETNIDEIFKPGFLGIYYRVDTTFVASMSGKSYGKWSNIFETYLSVCILKEMIDLLLELQKDMTLEEKKLTIFVKTFYKKFQPLTQNDEIIVDSLEKFRNYTDNILDKIEDIINQNSKEINVRLVNAGRFITDMCKAIKELFDNKINFKIFIDEYETLQEYQQKIVNTLIKHSEPPAIFNIGLRPQGMKTAATISETETIQAPHDFEEVSLDIDEDKYCSILKEICEKRIKLGREKGDIPDNASSDIINYLGKYKVDDEIELLAKNGKTFLHKKWLEDKIKELGISEKISIEDISMYIKKLCTDATVLESRLHYALISKKTTHTPSLKELLYEYENQTRKYQDWMHNRKFGLVFLLCKECKRKKLYYGFEVFAKLSSKNVRYFLELCEQAFRMAFWDEYNWQGEISQQIQTEAAIYVSKYKVTDISGYEPYGKELRIFIQYLGDIFYKLHTDKNTTLGEPEPNHFSTKDLSLSGKLKKLISSAIMWNVLQEQKATKQKESKLSPETVDYYINKIYVPYFGISYRNQRKISIDVPILELLFSGDETEARKGLNMFLKSGLDNGKKVNNIIASKQLSLFNNGRSDKNGK